MSNTPLEDQVQDALHQRVDPLQHAPFTVSDVRRRARRIQRRRNLAAGAAVAAALAIAVPVGLTMSQTTQRSDVQPASPLPSPTVIGTVRIDPRSAPIGDELAVPLINVDGPSLTTNGTTTDLPKPYDTLTPYMDGWVGVANNEGALSLEFLTEDFREQDGPVPTGGLVVSPDGGRIAWSEYSGTRWQVVTSDTAGGDGWTYTSFPPSPQQDVVRPLGFVSDVEVLASQTHAAGDVTTFLAAGDTPVALPGLLQPSSASPATGMVAGLTRSSSRGSACSGVVDGRARTGALEWETCDHVLGTFGPDGLHVVGFAPDADGYGSPTLSILDASTGEPVVDFEVAGARNQVVAINDRVAWEDSETLAITMVSGGQQYVVRLGLDGTVERVGGDSTQADFDMVPLRFAESR